MGTGRWEEGGDGEACRVKEGGAVGDSFDRSLQLAVASSSVNRFLRLLDSEGGQASTHEGEETCRLLSLGTFTATRQRSCVMRPACWPFHQSRVAELSSC